MAGVYIHVPFCAKACTYCDFHFSTVHKLKEPFLESLFREIDLRHDELRDEPIETIYFGGGTPSLLNPRELAQIFQKLERYEVLSNAEITLEANPENLTSDYLRELRQMPINRLSIGIQSFDDRHLKFMGRNHNAQEADAAIKRAQDYDFDKMTIDLIYGFPLLSDALWSQHLQRVLDYGIPHLSAYSLTVEPGTALFHGVKKGTLEAPREGQAAQHMEMLMDWAATGTFEHYEISNLARDGAYARHNTAYWKGKPYVGLGPSAHSYLQGNRSWNIANTPQYIKSTQSGKVPFTQEILTESDRYNEYIMTGLRTKWGVRLKDISQIGESFGEYFKESALKLITQGYIEESDGTFTLTRQGKLQADYIALELFWVDDQSDVN